MRKLLLTDAIVGTTLAGIVAAAAVDKNPGGISRTTPNTLTGRRMVQAKGAHIVTDDSHIPQEIRDHNAAIETRRAAKKAKKTT